MDSKIHEVSSDLPFSAISMMLGPQLNRMMSAMNDAPMTVAIVAVPLAAAAALDSCNGH